MINLVVGRYYDLPNGVTLYGLFESHPQPCFLTLSLTFIHIPNKEREGTDTRSSG